MPKGRNKQGGHVEKCHVHTVVTITAAAGVFNITNIYPGSFPRALAIADNFDEYRLVKFKYRLFRGATFTADSAVAFFPTVTASAPTWLNLYDNNTVCTLPLGAVAPTPWTHIPKALCAGLQPWYKAEAASLAAPDTLPGQIFGATISSTSDTCELEMDAVFEFRGEVNAADTPAPLPQLIRQSEMLQRRIELSVDAQKRRDAAERGRLATLLGYTETATVVPTDTRWPVLRPK